VIPHKRNGVSSHNLCHNSLFQIDIPTQNKQQTHHSYLNHVVAACFGVVEELSEMLSLCDSSQAIVRLWKIGDVPHSTDALFPLLYTNTNSYGSISIERQLQVEACSSVIAIASSPDYEHLQQKGIDDADNYETNEEFLCELSNRITLPINGAHKR
jgi:hypothetical protein